MAREDILAQSKKPLISQLNPGMGSGLDKRDKQLDRIKRQQQQILDSADGDVEATYIKKDPTTRDKYDIAFGSLNPGSVSKAKKYHNLEQKRLEIENEKVNLEGARDFMNQVYANQRAAINSQYDNLNKGYALGNDIALSNALATAGGAGGNVVQNSALKAQANNSLVAQLLQNQAQRDAALAQVDAQEANTPVTLSNLGAQNASIDATRAQEELARAQAEVYRNQGRTSGGSSGGGSSSYTKTQQDSDWKLGDDGLYHYKGLARGFTLEEAAAINDNLKKHPEEFNDWYNALLAGKVTPEEFIKMEKSKGSNSEAPGEEESESPTIGDAVLSGLGNVAKTLGYGVAAQGGPAGIAFYNRLLNSF